MIEGSELLDEESMNIETLNNTAKFDVEDIPGYKDFQDSSNVVEDQEKNSKKEKLYKKFTRYVSEQNDSDNELLQNQDEKHNKLTVCNITELTMQIKTIQKTPIITNTENDNNTKNMNSTNKIETAFSLMVDTTMTADLKGNHMKNMIDQNSSDSFEKSPQGNVKFVELDVLDN